MTAVTRHTSDNDTGRDAGGARAAQVGEGHEKLLVAVCWLVAVLMGGLVAPVGMTVQVMISRFRLSLASAGLIPLMMGGGRLVTAVASGWFSDLLGRKPVMIAGSIVTALSGFAYALSQWWWMSLTSMFGIGLGIGLLDVAANGLVADLSRVNRQAAINRLHAYFGVGSAAAPLVTAAFVAAGMGWEPVYLVASVAFLTVAVVLAIGHTEAAREIRINRCPKPPGASRSLGRSRTLVVLAVVSFFYGGLSRTVLTWANTYLEGMSVSPLAALYAVSLYNVGLAVGRFAAGTVIRWSYRAVFVVGSVGGLLSIVFSTLVGSLPVIAVSLMLTGLFIAALLPTAITWGSELFPHRVGTLTGLLSMSVAAGSMIIPWLTGAISDLAGLRFGMMSTGVVGGAVMAASVLLSRSDEGAKMR